MAARAILTCRPNSHPFQDRSVSLDQPVKIGRAVARAKPTASNAIFDCKVLSRNHALLWYETGKFYLQDTKSSNGTFVNNQRLSKSSEESLPREVCSGDIVQFGVDVMELNKKVTHGCIVATLQLFLPDGKEAKASSSTILPEKIPTTSVQEIYQLNQYIKEAMQREQLIETKLATINSLMASTKDAVESNWKVLIEEDRLLTRVDILERQLQASHKTMTDDKLREEVLQLQQDKEKYQTIAKEAIRKCNFERAEALRNLHDVQRNMNNTETEKTLLKEMIERNCQELKDMAEKFEESENKSKELTEEINQSASKYKEELELLNSKIKENETLLEDKQQLIESLMTKLESENAKVSHNQDLVKENQESTIRDLISDPDSLSKGDVEYPDGNMNVHWENSGEIESLKSQIKFVEAERKEILNKLSHLFNLIEDLKAVSNKVQASEFIQELIQKLDVEIRQIRNFSQCEEPLRNNSYNITNEAKVEPDVQKLDNHVDHRTVDGIQNFEKLLEESRQMNKNLQSDSVIVKQENKLLQEKIEESASQIKTYQVQISGLVDANEELKSRIECLQGQMDSSKKGAHEAHITLENLKKTAVFSDSQIIKLKDEISSLEAVVQQRDEKISKLMDQLGDLNRKNNGSLLEVACQTLQSLSDSDIEKSSRISNTTVVKSEDASSKIRDEASFKREQLMRLEEELASYKSSYNESAVECGTLRRKLAELQSQHEGFHNQSKLGPLHIIIPVVIGIILLAILIAFRPSS